MNGQVDDRPAARTPPDDDLGWGAGDVDPMPGHVGASSGYTTLCTTRDGSIDGGSRTGLTDFDTRILSRYRISLDGAAPQLVSSSQLDPSRQSITMWQPVPGGTPDGPQLPRDG